MMVLNLCSTMFFYCRIMLFYVYICQSCRKTTSMAMLTGERHLCDGNGFIHGYPIDKQIIIRCFIGYCAIWCSIWSFDSRRTFEILWYFKRFIWWRVRKTNIYIEKQVHIVVEIDVNYQLQCQWLEIHVSYFLSCGINASCFQKTYVRVYFKQWVVSKPAMTSKEYFENKNKNPLRISLNPIDKSIIREYTKLIKQQKK